MPKKKKTDETSPIAPNVDLSSDDETVKIEDISVELVEPGVTDVATEAAPALDSESAGGATANIDPPEGEVVAETDQPDTPKTQEAKQAVPKKRKTVKKAVEDNTSTVESRPAEAEDVSIEEVETVQNGVLTTSNERDDATDSEIDDGLGYTIDAETMLKDYAEEEKLNTGSETNDDFDSMFSMEDNEQSTDENEFISESKSPVELAREYSAIRASRTQNSTEVISQTTSVSDSETGGIFHGFSGKQRENNIDQERQMWIKLRRHASSGVPLLCTAIASANIDGEMCVICRPKKKNKDVLSNAIIFVPFPEMDISYGRTLNNQEKAILIKGSIGIMQWVCLTKVDETNEYCIGSIRLGNMRTRQEAFFKGLRTLDKSSPNKPKRQIIEKGSVVKKAFFEHINQDGALINIYGAQIRVPKRLLDHEFLSHPRKKFKPGEFVSVLILDLTTSTENFGVRAIASVKALKPDIPLEMLKKDIIQVGKPYKAEIAFIPSLESKSTKVLAQADMGFRCLVDGILTPKNFTVGSPVIVKLKKKDIQKGYGVVDLEEVLDYSPVIYE